MRFCFAAPALMLAAGIVLQAADGEPARRITLVVRADPHSGRLVRSAAKRPRPAPESVPLPQDLFSEPAHAIPEEIPPLVVETARRHGVDPLLVHSVISVESNYNHYAVSPKGAEGLMQLIPATARRFGVGNSFDPLQNLSGGVRYLKYLLDLYGNNRVLAIAAYNAGEGAVSNHNNRVPPYPETRNYVYRVGRKFGETKRAAAEKAARSPTPQTGPEEYRPIERTVDAGGRVHYRTR
jgi:soluble lytic murein transglycosylase-like protein